MKLHCVELPVMKTQARRSKTPKVAPLVALALLLLTIIPIYYPFVRYQNKNSSSDFSRISSPLPLCRDDNGLCSHEEVGKIPTTDHTKPESAEITHQGDPVQKLRNDNQLRDSTERTHEDDIIEKHPTLTNSDLVESSTSTTQSDQNEMGIKSILSNPEFVGTTQQEGVIETVFNGDMKTKSAALNNHESKKTSQSTKDVPWTTIDRGLKTSRRRDVGRSTPPPSNGGGESDCDIFAGEWVSNPEAPYYTNRTCMEIQQHQNCLKFGRPDTEYLKWKWKPKGCELPIFDPFEFLQQVRGKSLAFVGDSVARNHMQSLICLLSRVEEGVDISEIKYGSQFKRYEFPNYNFTVEIFWSPYLVKTTQTDDTTLNRPLNLFLDEFDEKWTTKIQYFDCVIISAGHWFFRPTMFYVQGRIVGCLYCQETNITHLTSHFSYRRAFRTAFRAINSLENFKGITFLRTFAPSHFEDGYWDKGGDCVRTRPFRNGEVHLEGYSLEHYKIQIEELKIAERLGRRRGLKFRLFDVTQAMLLRPDGHPSKYGHWPQTNISLANDCVHWCLPGPIDTWNDFLIELLKREEKT